MSKIKKIAIVLIAILVIAILADMVYCWWFIRFGFPTLYKGDYPITR